LNRKPVKKQLHPKKIKEWLFLATVINKMPISLFKSIPDNTKPEQIIIFL